MRLQKISLFAMLFVIAPYALAQANHNDQITQTTEQTAGEPANQTATNPPQDVKLTHCPKPNQLTRKDLKWGAKGGWRSYNQSFVEQVTRFSGAQWQGINVGTVICTYQGDNESDFPVTVQNSTLALMPSGGMWIQDTKSSRVNCLSNDVQNCPFHMTVQTAPTEQQIHDTLQSIAPKHSVQDQQ